MLSEAKEEVDSRKRIGFSFGFIAGYADVSIVVKRDGLAVIVINTGSADAWTTKITSNVFDELFQIFIALKIFRRRLSTDNEAIGIFFTKSFIDWCKIRDAMAKLFQKDVLVGKAEVPKRNIWTISPGTPFGQTAFGGETMNMRIPI